MLARSFLPVALCVSACSGSSVSGDEESSSRGGSAGVSSSGGSSGGGGSAGIEAGEPCATTDFFDPNQVYMVGRVGDGECAGLAILNPRCPEQAVTGLACGDYGRETPEVWEDAFSIRRQDARLVFWNRSAPAGEELVEFRCDGCPSTGGIPPADPHANDLVIPSPCEPCAASTLEGPPFLVSPTGEMFFHCACPSERWLSTTGTTFDASSVGHLGYSGLGINSGEIVGGLAAVPIQFPISGVVASFLAVRAMYPSSFLVALANYPTNGDVSFTVVTSTGESGTPSKYPNAPPGVAMQPHARLDSTGVLYQLGITNDTGSSVLVRRRMDFVPDILYAGSDGAIAADAGWTLVTGP